MQQKAFSDLRIIDCTQGIGGPYCTKLFADFGAEVIKVENPNGGDPTRKCGPFLNDNPHPEKSIPFFFLNTNKKSVTLDVEIKEGADLFRKLLQGADIVIENLGPGIMASLGLSDEMLKQVEPDIVLTHISPFGASGPYRDFEASNLTLYALSGALHTMRSPEKPLDQPVLQGGWQAEYITGLIGFIASAAALFNKQTTGQGTEIDLGSMEAVSSILSAHISEYSYLGLSRRTNPWAVHGYPIGYSVPCRDGWVSLTPGLGGAPNIATLIERPELKEDHLFSKPAARMAEPEKFDALIRPWMNSHDKWEITTQAQGLRLAFTPVLSGSELLGDVQLRSREYFGISEHPAMGEVLYPGAPAKLSRTPWQEGRAPLLGEHNKDVYTGLGLTEEDLMGMQRKKII